MRLHFVGLKHLRYAFEPDQRSVGTGHVLSRYYLSLMRSKLSQADMSDRITLSPTFNPFAISMVLTELRPNFTLTRTASSSSTSLKIPTAASDWPFTGR